MRFFNHVSLSTPESVELEFTLAGIGSRAFALMIDYSILMAVLLLFWIVWGVFTYGLLNTLTESGALYQTVFTWMLAIALLANFAISAGYFTFFEVMWQGQTPGKRLANIRVVRDNGRPIGLVQAALRALLRTVDDFLFIGVFFILFNSREKRLGDMVAGTLVIQDQRGDRRENLALSEAAQPLAAKLPEMTDLTQLMPDDFAVIHAYLLRRQSMATRARNDLSLNLARQIRTLIQLEKIPAGTTSDQFLEAVYLAYQQQADGDRSL